MDTDFIKGYFYLLNLFTIDRGKISLTANENSNITLLHGNNATATTINFFPGSINVKNSECDYKKQDETLVFYIYYLMKLCHEEWMNCIVDKMCIPLELLSKMALPGHIKCESVMRRIFTPLMGLLEQLGSLNRMMSGDEYGDYFKLSSSNLGKNRIGETIYSHDFQWLSLNSKRMNFHTLSHLLLMEAVLNEWHNWEEMYPNCYFCKIEKYDFTIWRYQWSNNIFWSSFLDPEIARKMKNAPDTLNVSSKITQLFEQVTEDTNEIPKFYLYLASIECDIGTQFLQKYFFERRKITFKVHSLKELCKYQLSIAIFLRRLYLFAKCSLTLIDINKPEIIENTEEFKEKLNSSLVYFDRALTGVKKSYVLRSTVHGYIDSITESDLFFIFDKATKFPLETHIDALQYSDYYKYFGYVTTFPALKSLAATMTTARKRFKNM